MSSSYVRDVSVAPEFKEQVEDLMWGNRTTMSALMRDAIQRFADNGLDGIKDPTDPGAGPESLRFSITPELWEAAEAKTWEIRIKRPDGIRIVLADMIAAASKPKPRARKAATK